MLWLQLGPSVISQLSTTEDVIYASVNLQGIIDLLCMTFVSKLQLVLQIVESVVG